jgi:hypothetical protein
MLGVQAHDLVIRHFFRLPPRPLPGTLLRRRTPTGVTPDDGLRRRWKESLELRDHLVPHEVEEVSEDNPEWISGDSRISLAED